MAKMHINKYLLNILHSLSCFTYKNISQHGVIGVIQPFQESKWRHTVRENLVFKWVRILPNHCKSTSLIFHSMSIFRKLYKLKKYTLELRTRVNVAILERCVQLLALQQTADVQGRAQSSLFIFSCETLVEDLNLCNTQPFVSRNSRKVLNGELRPPISATLFGDGKSTLTQNSNPCQLMNV